MRNLSASFSRLAFYGALSCAISVSGVAHAQTQPEVTPKTITGTPVEPLDEQFDDEVPDYEAMEIPVPQTPAGMPPVYSKPLPLPEDMGVEMPDFDGTRPNAAARPENVERRQQREARETNLRRLMVTFGVQEREEQNAVLEFIVSETRARTQLRLQSNRLYEAMNSRQANEEQVAEALQAYRDALKAERERRLQSEDELDERLDFRNQPRLEAFLILSGLIGDGPMSLPVTPRRAPNWQQAENRGTVRTENRANASKRPKDRVALPNLDR